MSEIERTAGRAVGLDEVVERHRLRQIIDQIPAAVWTTDSHLVITTSLGGALESLGLVADQLVGAALDDILRNDPVRDAAIAAHEAALCGQSISYESEWSGRELYTRVQPLRDGDGRIAGTLGVSFDISARKEAERRYQSLFERNVAGVFRSTVSGRLLECNDAFLKIFGYETREEAYSVSTPQLYVDAGARAELVATLRDRGELINFEGQLRRRDGSTVWVLLNETLVRSNGEEVLEGTIVDITARKEAEERMLYLAFHDALTDLPNRALLSDRLNIVLARARRHQQLAAVMFLDLDQFKLINDTMAHTAGDELLRGLASRLTASLRSDDTVARIGGDEFVFIIPEIDQPATAAHAAERILSTVRRPFEIQGRELIVTASIGIAVFPHDGTDGDTLIKNADAAMYRAKELGRNTYQFYTPVTQKRAEVRLTLETALRRAIERDELFLVYQPIVELATGRIVRFEALLRWDRRSGGMLEPDHFIPLAEEIGSIVPIGAWALRTACKQMRAWRDAGHTFGVSVNLSPRQFQHEGLTALVEEALADSHLPPSALELEITESLSMRDSDLTVGRLSHFRSLGIRVALDDFGSGFSSMNHLRFLPIDAIKIDRTFITGLHEGSPERMLVQAMVQMAHALRLRVVAEGVETEEQRRILHELGCDDIQGFVVARPMRAEEIAL